MNRGPNNTPLGAVPCALVCTVAVDQRGPTAHKQPANVAHRPVAHPTTLCRYCWTKVVFVETWHDAARWRRQETVSPLAGTRDANLLFARIWRRGLRCALFPLESTERANICPHAPAQRALPRHWAAVPTVTTKQKSPVWGVMKLD